MHAIRPSYWPSRPHISSNSKFSKSPSEYELVSGIPRCTALLACEFALWSVAAPSVTAYLACALLRCKREIPKYAVF